MIIDRIKNLIKNINYLSKQKLWEQREKDIVYLTKKIIDDVCYEYNLSDLYCSKLSVLNKKDSFEVIQLSKKSFIRFGDGEVNLMLGKSQPFQKYDKELVERLYSILRKPRDDIYICINYDYFSSLNNLYSDKSDYNRRFSYDFRKFFVKNCNPNTKYLDGAVTFWYELGENSSLSSAFWTNWKEFFKNEKIAIVCGEGILDKLEYDIFELAIEKKYIYGPRKHAWDARDSIIYKIEKEVPKDWKLVFILGMAGKALIPEMVDKGYISWDIGHLAKSYNLFMQNKTISASVISEFFKPD